MTDEEKAEEYAIKITEGLRNKGFLTNEEINQRFAGIIQGVLFGLEEGKPKWHDLRKDPDGLPRSKNSTETPVLLAYKSAIDGEIVVEEYIYIEGIGFISLESYYQGDYREPLYFKKEGVLIAWCELPKFEE